MLKKKKLMTILKNKSEASSIVAQLMKASLDYDHIESLLPASINSDFFIKSCMLYISQEESLLKCTGDSILASMYTAAQVGLVPSRQTRQAYFVAAKDECQFLPGYRGLLDLCYRSGMVKSVGSRIVYSDDEFTFKYGTTQFIDHAPSMNPNPSRVMTHAYCVIELNGGIFFEVRSKDQIDERRMNCSLSSRWFWDNYYDEMARNEILKITLKTVPVSHDVQHAVGLSDNFEYGDLQRTKDSPEPELATKKKVMAKAKSSVNMIENLIKKTNDKINEDNI